MSDIVMNAVTNTPFRNKDIWGDDADVWRPSRWIDGSVKSPRTNVGVWTNLYAESSLYVCYMAPDLFVLECLLALDIVPVSGGSSRKYLDY